MKKVSSSYDIILRPLTTEKGTRLKGDANQVCFVVQLDANKSQIRDAVEDLFDVSVRRVNTQVVRGKKVTRYGRTVGQRTKWKKAVVTLGPDDSIDFYAGA